MKKNPFKAGDSVIFTDGDMRVFQVYAVYNNTMVSLGLADYPDVEQDNLTPITEIKKIKLPKGFAQQIKQHEKGKCECNLQYGEQGLCYAGQYVEGIITYEQVWQDLGGK